MVAYRWHLPDPVRFKDSLRVELEHGHGNEVVADFATVAYWYQVEPHRPFSPLPSPDQRRTLDVKVPAGAVFLDSIEVERREGSWFARLPVPRPDLYDVWVYPRAPDGRPASPSLLLQGHSVPGGSVELEVATASEVRADLPVAIHPVPHPVWATDWMVVGPFPNPQQVGTEYSSALDSIYSPEVDPDLARVLPSS